MKISLDTLLMILCCLFEMKTPIFLTLILILTLFSKHDQMVSAYRNCPSDQQQSLLLNLKNSLIFDTTRSTKLSKWKTNSSSWVGVTFEEGRVTGLDLSNESISGGINASSSLFNLEYLQKLNLAFNNFNYLEIPSQIGKLSSLHYLNLSNAGFVGQVPIAVSELTKLTTLDLSSVYFEGNIMLQLKNPNLKMLVGNLSELTELYLDGVYISASGAEWCGALSSSLPKLQLLSMSNCFLSGPIDRSLTNLQNLSMILLSGNNFSTTIPDFIADFSNLTSLRLASAGLFGQFPERIFTVPSLQNLDLSNNYLLNGSLPEFPRGGSLRTMALSYTRFSGVLPNSIGYLQNLSRIELVNCSFSGQIPSSMANLTQLVYLDFTFNNFTGSIPSFSSSKNLTDIIFFHNGLTGQINSTHWEYLHNLHNLDLRSNMLEGGIPSSLFMLPLIQSIQLSGNRFSGAFKLDKSLNFSSYQLETIDISRNNLSGRFPGEFLEFPQLKYLSLSFNNFSGFMDIKEIQGVRNLSYLDLSYNNLFIDDDGSGSGIRSFPPLNTLRLAFCHLRKFPSFLKNQPNLTDLDLSNNEIEGMIPEWLWTLPNLWQLNLSSNLLEGPETPLWNLPPGLNVLDLHDNNLQGPIPVIPEFAAYVDYSSNNFSSFIPENIGQNLSFTILLSLSNNRLYGSIPHSICGADLLRLLDLSSNNITGSIPSCLMMIDSLHVLNLRNNCLTGGIPDNFTVNCGLKTLNLWRNQLQGKLPQSLKSCTSLEVLDVGSNQFEDVFPCHLMNTTKLRVLVLRSNRFSGQIGCSLVGNGWSFLQIVDLANNLFTALPPANFVYALKAMQVKVGIDRIRYQHPDFSRYDYQDSVTVTIKGMELELVKILTVFTSIDFSANKINGSIPAAIGNFTALRLLNLSHNALSGPIPLSLGNMHVLESLDLSKNQLRRTIPTQLVNLNFLSVLNLSGNEFVGRIPVGKQFNTFTEDSYRGNTGLCGVPLQRNCDESPVEKPEAGFNNDDDDVFGWEFFMAVGIGFVGAAATVIACLAPWRRNRGRSNDLVDKFVLLLRLWF